jgi:peptidoglycan-N-acetylglucosamine deacetylase
VNAAVVVVTALLGAVDGGAEPARAPIDGGTPAPAVPIAVPESIAPVPLAIPPFAIRNVSTAEPVVALTFDACATAKQANGFDRPIFDILAKQQIPATFYLSGRWVEKHTDAAKLIAAATFVELGNHSYTHPHLTLLRPDRMRGQIRLTNKILERTLGRRPLTLRPPGGAWDKPVVRAAIAEGLPVVTWSVVSGDVGGHVPAARMVRSVLDQTKPGSIIIFHINQRGPLTKKALPDIIAGLRDKGMRFVTVSQLLAIRDAIPLAARPSRMGFRMRVKHPAVKEEEPTEPSEPSPPTPKEEGDEHAHPPT